MSLTQAVLRPLIPVFTAAVALVADVAPADADNTKFPAAVAQVDTDAEKDSLGGGKSENVAIAGPATSPEAAVVPEVKDPSADPGGFIGDVTDAGKKSWPLGVLLGIIGAAILARKYVSSLRVPGTRLAAGISAGIAAATALLFWRLGQINMEEFMSALGIAIALVLSPAAPELPPPATEKPAGN